MKNLYRKKDGNITLMIIIMSAMIMSFGITVTTVLTSSIISVKNISKANEAYYIAESGAEKGYYIFSGHMLGFEYNYDNDSTCEISSGEDIWCLQSRLNSIPSEDNEYETLQANSMRSIGLFNDVSDNPFGAISTSSVNINIHELIIYIAPSEGSDATSNNLTSIGDIRITGVSAATYTYGENSQIETDDYDIGFGLVDVSSSSTLCSDARYGITGNDYLWDSGEFVYRDIDFSGDVSEGDVRMTDSSSYGAGTAVVWGDTDVGLVLRENAENMACSTDDEEVLYATDIAQIVLSGEDDNGNKSINLLLSKNHLMGKSLSNPYILLKTAEGNVGNQNVDCSIQDFFEEDSADCGHVGVLNNPQLEIYAFSEKLDYRVESTFSDFKVDFDDNACSICNYIDIAGASGDSTTYDYVHSSEDNIVANLPIGIYTLQVQEYGKGIVSSSSFSTAEVKTPQEVSVLLQASLNDSAALNYDYSVSYRDAKFHITATGITLTNPEITLISKGVYLGKEQSIETSITDSSLVPIFGWYSVF